MYISLDGGYFEKINDYNGFTDTFNIPVSFGAVLDADLNPFRFFEGTLSDMSVAFISDNATIDDYNPSKRLVLAYQHDGPYVFDGETELQTVFLKTDDRYRSFLLQLFRESETFRGKYVTIIESTDGLLFLTQNRQQLTTLLESLIKK